MGWRGELCTGLVFEGYEIVTPSHVRLGRLLEASWKPALQGDGKVCIGLKGSKGALGLKREGHEIGAPSSPTSDGPGAGGERWCLVGSAPTTVSGSTRTTPPTRGATSECAGLAAPSFFHMSCPSSSICGSECWPVHAPALSALVHTMHMHIALLLYKRRGADICRHRRSENVTACEVRKHFLEWARQEP